MLYYSDLHTLFNLYYHLKMFIDLKTLIITLTSIKTLDIIIALIN